MAMIQDFEIRITEGIGRATRTYRLLIVPKEMTKERELYHVYGGDRYFEFERVIVNNIVVWRPVDPEIWHRKSDMTMRGYFNMMAQEIDKRVGKERARNKL